MNRLKKRIAAMSALALCLSLCACNQAAEDDIAGDDWRASGVVVGSGTITHDGESVDVLVKIGKSSAAFYRDEPEQILFDSVSFPMEIPDAQDAFNAISFDDLNDDGESDVSVSFIHENGDTTDLIWIWDPEERYVFREDLSSVTIADDGLGDLIETEEYLDDYVGLWEYIGENRWLRIYDDASWEFLNEQEDVLDYGTLWADENGVTLHFDGSGDVLELLRTVSGDLIDSVNDGTLLPTDEIRSQEPYFVRNNIAINAAVDQGTFLLEDGVSNYYGLGDDYSTNDCHWEIIPNGDYTHDGIRELHFDAVCYIADNDNYDVREKYTVVSGELYDSYTGMWLTTSSTFNNSSRGDNYYLHTVSYGGNSYLIEFAYSTDWSYNVGDWDTVLTKSYAVYIPEDYDGLVFAAQAAPSTYRDCAKRLQADSIYPEAEMLDIETLDPYSSLYFSLCDY